MLKNIVIIGDIQVIDKYYLIPHYSGKYLMLKLYVGVENKLEDQPSEMCTCSWEQTPTPTPPPQAQPPGEDQTAADSSHLLALDT